MRKLIIIVISAGIGMSFFVLPNSAQTTDIPTRLVNTKAIMHRKLESSQSLIKGLALEDFELLAKETQTLQVLSLDAGWNVVQTRDYARISGEFRDAARKIEAASKKQNLEAAGLGYFQLTMTCIDCHRHVRKVKAKK